jgi:hypothetical protein
VVARQRRDRTGLGRPAGLSKTSSRAVRATPCSWTIPPFHPSSLSPSPHSRPNSRGFSWPAYPSSFSLMALPTWLLFYSFEIEMIRHICSANGFFKSATTPRLFQFLLIFPLRFLNIMKLRLKAARIYTRILSVKF